MSNIVLFTVLTLVPFVFMIYFFESVLIGAVRGSGRQKIGAIVNLGAYYLIGIPLAILFAFVLHLGGKGLWFGIIAALLAQAFFLFILTLCTNWEMEAKKANRRVYDSMTRDEVS
ncbi:hypothetical protein L1987_21126 [Smallanthus sonchifolius]|uniref:Uncharacterized protein n=1 Tax=Smallanthus sonchifolius TaxID=185202 RepID=A0ACB9IT31_9ASTR|nr:hypothetical protein L1987_21126 [Smallanthus sonchifolius]